MQNKKLIVENKIYYWVRIDEMTTLHTSTCGIPIQSRRMKKLESSNDQLVITCKRWTFCIIYCI